MEAVYAGKERRGDRACCSHFTGYAESLSITSPIYATSLDSTPIQPARVFPYFNNSFHPKKFWMK